MEVFGRRICGNCERIMKIEKKKIIIWVFTAVLIIVGAVSGGYASKVQRQIVTVSFLQ